MSKREKEHREFRDYLNDIVQSIGDIRSFTKGITYENFTKDKKTLYAVIRCLEVLGEAVKKVPLPTRKRYSEIPWEAIAGMRDKLIHEYFGVDTETLWDTIREDLPLLHETAVKMIHDLK